MGVETYTDNSIFLTSCKCAATLTAAFFYGAICPGGGKMAERIVLSNSDFLRVLVSIDFESGFHDLDPEDIAQHIQFYQHSF